MTPTYDARAWLVWATTVTAVGSLVRNPWLCALLLATVLAVGARLVPNAVRAGLGVARLAVWLGSGTVVFNLLSVRVGDVVLAQAPESWPIIGGVFTLNAALYGLQAATALLAIVAAWAVFGAVVSHGDLIRLTPNALHLAGTVVSIAGTFAPGMVRALGEVREAQALRGHRPRGPADLAPMLVPVLALGVERGLTLAEAMESRGFGRNAALRPRRHWRVVVGSAALVGAAGIALVPGGIGLAPFVAAAGGVILFLEFGQHAAGRTRYRPRRWTRHDGLLLAGTAAAAAAVTAQLLLDPAALRFTVYPTIVAPTLPALGLAGVLLLLAPALLAEGGPR